MCNHQCQQDAAALAAEILKLREERDFKFKLLETVGAELREANKKKRKQQRGHND